MMPTTTHLPPLYALHGPASQAFVAGVAAWLVTHDSITRDRVAQIAAEAAANADYHAREHLPTTRGNLGATS